MNMDIRVLVYLFVYQNLEITCLGALYERREVKKYEHFLWYVK